MCSSNIIDHFLMKMLGNRASAFIFKMSFKLKCHLS